jgi:hypothetical protein
MSRRRVAAFSPLLWTVQAMETLGETVQDGVTAGRRWWLGTPKIPKT